MGGVDVDLGYPEGALWFNPNQMYRSVDSRRSSDLNSPERKGPCVRRLLRICRSVSLFETSRGFKKHQFLVKLPMLMLIKSRNGTQTDSSPRPKSHVYSDTRVVRYLEARQFFRKAGNTGRHNWKFECSTRILRMRFKILNAPRCIRKFTIHVPECITGIALIHPSCYVTSWQPSGRQYFPTSTLTQSTYRCGPTCFREKQSESEAFPMIYHYNSECSISCISSNTWPFLTKAWLREIYTHL